MPITTEQVNSFIEQNQQLQSELDQSLLAHRNDAEQAREVTKQTDAQFQSDFRVMRTEFEKSQAEWAKKARVDKERYEASVHVERQQSNEHCRE